MALIEKRSAALKVFYRVEVIVSDMTGGIHLRFPVGAFLCLPRIYRCCNLSAWFKLIKSTITRKYPGVLSPYSTI